MNGRTFSQNSCKRGKSHYQLLVLRCKSLTCRSVLTEHQGQTGHSINCSGSAETGHSAIFSGKKKMFKDIYCPSMHESLKMVFVFDNYCPFTHGLNILEPLLVLCSIFTAPLHTDSTVLEPLLVLCSIFTAPLHTDSTILEP